MSNNLTITFKTPDVVDLALEQELTAQDELRRDKTSEGLSEDELFELGLNWQDFLDDYIEYGEYITIKFNLDSKTVKVVPVKQ